MDLKFGLSRFDFPGPYPGKFASWKWKVSVAVGYRVAYLIFIQNPCGLLLFALFNIYVGVNDENTYPNSDKFLLFVLYVIYMTYNKNL